MSSFRHRILMAAVSFIRSCFGGGFWDDNAGWDNNDGWIN